MLAVRRTAPNTACGGFQIRRQTRNGMTCLHRHELLVSPCSHASSNLAGAWRPHARAQRRPPPPPHPSRAQGKSVPLRKPFEGGEQRWPSKTIQSKLTQQSCPPQPASLGTQNSGMFAPAWGGGGSPWGEVRSFIIGFAIILWVGCKEWLQRVKTKRLSRPSSTVRRAGVQVCPFG